jgi:hypothetical protein
MTAEEKIARHRLSVLELGQALGNISEACRRRGMTRTQFDDYKRRFELQGLEGLKDLPPIHKTHPQTTPPELAEQIVTLSLAHPAWGCVRLAAHLKLQGVTVSSPTIQSILIKHGIGTRFERLLKLEERVAAEPIELTPEQITAIEEAKGVFSGAARREQRAWGMAGTGHVSGGQLQGRGQSLFAHGGGYLWLVCFWLLAYWEAA